MPKAKGKLIFRHGWEREPKTQRLSEVKTTEEKMIEAGCDPVKAKEIAESLRYVNEARYRKGFYHGYWHGMNDCFVATRRKLKKRLFMFFDRVLRPWQLRSREGLVFPPRFDPKQPYEKPNDE